MSARMSSRVGMLTVLGLLLAGGALGQEPRDVAIRRIQVGAQRTPEYTVKVRGSVRERTRDWTEISVYFETQPEMIDELEFTYYVIMRREDPREPFALLKGTVTYLYVERGRHQSVMYLHPSVVARFGSIDGIAVEVRARGRLIAVETQGASGPRYQQALQQLPARENHVLNPMQTPFAMIGYDNQPMMKW